MSKKVPALTARDIIKVLEKVGFRQTRQSGSHAIYRRDEDKRRTVVPIHSKKTLKRKTLKSILDDANLSLDDLKKWL